MLTEKLDFEQVVEGANRTRFKLHCCRPGTTEDIFHRPDGSRGTGGVGTVHHVAWRALNDTEQLKWAREINLIEPLEQKRADFQGLVVRDHGGFSGVGAPLWALDTL